MDQKIELRHSVETHELRGAIYDVRHELKAGWSEEIYHRALVQTLEQRHIPVSSKLRRSLIHRGTEVHVFEPDIVVWDKIVLELKVLPNQIRFASENFAQIIQYLKFLKMDLGLLVNFAPAKVHIKRVVWDEIAPEIMEDYETIKPLMTDLDKIKLRQVRKMIIGIAQSYGLGYLTSIYKNLVAAELQYAGLNCSTSIEIPLTWQGTRFACQTVQILLVEDKYLIDVLAMLEGPTTYHYTRLKTFLTSLGLPFGLIVNFGRKGLQIFGINATN